MAERASVEHADESSFARDEGAITNALLSIVDAARSGPVVGFVGKLILSKGIDLLLAAWPLVLGEIPSASLAIIGFGAYEGAVERWIEALSSADMDAVRELTASGAAAEGGARAPLRFLGDFLEDLERSGDLERYLTAARPMPDRVVLTGRLEHDELAMVLPALEALVVPSTFPESFGMVVVEAAACGALPISADHSGLAEVSRTVARALPGPVRELTTFEIGPLTVPSIANRVLKWLKMPRELRDSAETALPQAVAARYAWPSIARGVIAAAHGELDRLEPPA
jgi:glycosyltransferase involved in cell wall biosynthesis